MVSALNGQMKMKEKENVYRIELLGKKHYVLQKSVQILLHPYPNGMGPFIPLGVQFVGTVGLGTVLGLTTHHPLVYH